MSADLQPDVQLEIGHVLFMDVVGYSKYISAPPPSRNTDAYDAAEAHVYLAETKRILDHCTSVSCPWP
jgi:hypothetical protein